MLSSKDVSTSRASVASVVPQPTIGESVVLSQPVHTLIRATMLLITVANTALLAMFAPVYLQNDKRDSLLWFFGMYFLYSESNAFVINYGVYVGTTYAVLSAIFGLLTLNQLRELPRRHRHRVNPATAPSTTGGRRAIRPLLALYESWHQAVGVRGPYFELRHLAGELVEISSQTVAAVSASQSISNAPLNIVYAVVIFLNCVSATVVPLVFKTNTTKQRIACLVADNVLDFVWGALLPIWMYLPIVKLWLDREHLAAYMDSFANSTRALERVLIISWKMYAISIIPFGTSCLSLLKLNTALREVLSKPDSTKRPSQAQYHAGQSSSRVVVRIAHALLSVYGLSIFILAIRASSVASGPPFGCVHRVYPWFGIKEACLSLQFNCTRMGIQGTASEVEQAMGRFDEASLSDLFVLNCPGFEMPPKIHAFKRLMSILVKNSTIVAWSEAAMLRGDVFQELRSIQLKRVEFVSDPIGLVGNGPIAASIEWMYMEYLDGSRILPLVGDHWKDVRYFACHACGLDALPVVVYQMPRLILVDATSNNLTSIPDDWITRANIHLETLLLDGNPQLTELPDSIWGQAASSSLMSMIATNLSSVPEWIADVARDEFLLLAVATPVCARPESVPARVKPRVVCSQVG